MLCYILIKTLGKSKVWVKKQYNKKNIWVIYHILKHYRDIITPHMNLLLKFAYDMNMNFLVLHINLSEFR